MCAAGLGGRASKLPSDPCQRGAQHAGGEHRLGKLRGHAAQQPAAGDRDRGAHVAAAVERREQVLRLDRDRAVGAERQTAVVCLSDLDVELEPPAARCPLTRATQPAYSRSASRSTRSNRIGAQRAIASGSVSSSRTCSVVPASQISSVHADPAVSPDGTRLAMTDGGGDQSDMMLAFTNGPAWVGEPPYPEIDYTQIDFTDPQSDVPRPTLRCQTATGAYSNPTWSTDSREVAYGSTDGVHVMIVPADWDCSKLVDRMLAPGGSDPAFGPADVNMAQKPPPRGPSPTPTPNPHPGPHPRGAVVLRNLLIAPHRFRVASARAAAARRGGALVRFTLNRVGRVTLTVSSRRRSRGRAVIAAAAGVNSVRFTGWLSGHRLAPGRYQLVGTAGARSSSVTFQVLR